MIRSTNSPRNFGNVFFSSDLALMVVHFIGKQLKNTQEKNFAI